MLFYLSLEQIKPIHAKFHASDTSSRRGKKRGVFLFILHSFVRSAAVVVSERVRAGLSDLHFHSTVSHFIYRLRLHQRNFPSFNLQKSRKHDTAHWLVSVLPANGSVPREEEEGWRGEGGGWMGVICHIGTALTLLSCLQSSSEPVLRDPSVIHYFHVYSDLSKHFKSRKRQWSDCSLKVFFWTLMTHKYSGKKEEWLTSSSQTEVLVSCERPVSVCCHDRPLIWEERAELRSTIVQETQRPSVCN